ncbi:MAG: ATP-dependent DNA helicase [Candidatus Woesearchaeota archaeon]
MEFLFPHDKVRKIQPAFMQQVYSTIENKGQLIVHAPTGIGKTAAALSSAITYALKHNCTVFFLTSRHTQHRIAIDTIRKINEKNKAKVNAVDLIGKKWMCNVSGVKALTSSEFSDYCKTMREKGECEHYRNIKEKGKLSVLAHKALSDINKKGAMHVEEFNKACSSMNLCPFEMVCILAREAHVIIADYYHILHPSIRDNLFKRIQKDLGQCIIIFDEGHNLPARARELLTSSVSTFTISAAEKEARKMGYDDVAAKIPKLNETLLSMSKQNIKIEDHEALMDRREFVNAVEKELEYEGISAELHFVADAVLEERKRSFCSSVATFLDSWPGPDEGFVRVISKDFNKQGKPFTLLSYKCLDPSIAVRPLVEECHSVIAMSGTLNPAEMYRDLLGFDSETTVMVEYDNPFPQENRLTMIIPETSTKYASRGNEMYGKIAQKCSAVVNSINGNSLVFFPSYKLMSSIYPFFNPLCKKTTLMERSGMSKEEKEDMIDNFKAYKKIGAVMLGVSAGSLGEGIDLPGDFLKAVVVVGLPLAKPDLETKELIKYYDLKFKKGWDYGYIYPAIIKTMQNAGRCIRSETDRGVMVFLDERYVWERYYRCFPKDWNIKVSVNPEQEIGKFFG